MKRPVWWMAGAVLAVLATALASLPAAWLTPLLEQQTGGRLSLGDPQGSIWSGTAFIGVAGDPEQPLVPLLPGRFRWQLSPLALVGVIDARVQNPQVLEAPVSVHGSWRRWAFSDASLILPAERLSALGAPLNTVRPSGQMRLSWRGLVLARVGAALQADGHMQLVLTDMASALSPVKPLGAYRIRFDWQRGAARVDLKSLSGPLLLTGQGVLADGRLQFSGQAWAAEGEEQRLAILLNLLGQRRQVGNRTVIALEFR